MNKLRKIILAGLLLAAAIILDRFLSIKSPIVTIGFSFVATILSAMLLGTGWSIMIAGLADLLGALMFPFGAYFPGYTASAVLAGLIYGLFLNNAHKRSWKDFLWRIIVSCVLVSLICNIGLNTLWIYITTKKAVAVLLPTRLIKEAILIPIRIIVMQALHLTFLKSGAYKRLFKIDTEKLQNTETNSSLSTDISADFNENNNNEDVKTLNTSIEEPEKSDLNNTNNSVKCKYCNTVADIAAKKCPNCGAEDFGEKE